MITFNVADEAHYSAGCGWTDVPETLTGVRCGNHRYASEIVRHWDVAAVRACYGKDATRAADAAAEAYAEGAWLRHAEGGWDTTGEYLADSIRTGW